MTPDETTRCDDATCTHATHRADLDDADLQIAHAYELLHHCTLERDAALAEVERLRTQKDGAYAERNQCVALIARMARAFGWTAGIRQHDPADAAWEADWRTIVMVDLPTGQVSWHFHDSECHLIASLPAYEKPWDGHDTAEKYRRVNAPMPMWGAPYRHAFACGATAMREAAAKVVERAAESAVRESGLQSDRGLSSERWAFAAAALSDALDDIREITPPAPSAAETSAGIAPGPAGPTSDANVAAGATPAPGSPAEWFKSRGIGNDNTPGCFICGGPDGLRNNIAAFVPSKESGERVVAMFGAGARLDYREHEPNWIQVKVGACDAHRDQLEDLHLATQKAGNHIDRQMVGRIVADVVAPLAPPRLADGTDLSAYTPKPAPLPEEGERCADPRCRWQRPCPEHDERDAKPAAAAKLTPDERAKVIAESAKVRAELKRRIAPMHDLSMIGGGHPFSCVCAQCVDPLGAKPDAAATGGGIVPPYVTSKPDPEDPPYDCGHRTECGYCESIEHERDEMRARLAEALAERDRQVDAGTRNVERLNAAERRAAEAEAACRAAQDQLREIHEFVVAESFEAMRSLSEPAVHSHAHACLMRINACAGHTKVKAALAVAPADALRAVVRRVFLEWAGDVDTKSNGFDRVLDSMLAAPDAERGR